MIVADFEKKLFKKSDNMGGTFQKADFHVHMPGSSDYEYKGVDAMALLAKTLNDGNCSFAVVLVLS